MPAEAPPELALIVGYPERGDDGLFNAVALVRGGKIETVYRKHHLPNHSVFDEQRVFDSDDKPRVFACGGIKFGHQHLRRYLGAGAGRACAGSRRGLAAGAERFAVSSQQGDISAMPWRARGLIEAGLPIVYANLVGGQDELVFDGASFVDECGG